MTTITFDALAYLERLRSVGFTEEQAKVQTEFWRDLTEAQARMLREQAEAQARQAEAQARQIEAHARQAEARDAELKETLSQFDEASRRELATKGDIYDIRLEIEKLRTETEKIRAELKSDIEKVRAELKLDIEKVRGEIKSTELRLLKWQIGIALAGFGTLGAIMAKGFGWLGF